jgi:hypothetical protein
MSKCAFVFILEKDFNQPMRNQVAFIEKENLPFMSDYSSQIMVLIVDVISVNHRLRVPLRL